MVKQNIVALHYNLSEVRTSDYLLLHVRFFSTCGECLADLDKPYIESCTPTLPRVCFTFTRVRTHTLPAPNVLLASDLESRELLFSFDGVD